MEQYETIWSNMEQYRYLRYGSKATNIAYPTVTYAWFQHDEHSIP